MQSGGSPVDPAATLTASYNPGDGSRPRFNTVGAQVEVVNPRPVAGEVSEALILTGQSTIANWGSGTAYVASSSKSHMGNPLNGRVYPARDSMFFCDGTGSGPGSALGDQRIALGVVQRVLVVNASFGSTTSAQWADATGQPFLGFLVAWNFLLAHGWSPSQIKHIHQQGEADANAGTSQATMLANIQAIASNKTVLGITSPMWVSQTTFPYGGWDTSNPNAALWTPGAAAILIRNAQLAAVNGTTIRQGPDTDLIRGYVGGRGTGAHWGSQAECIACAAAWATAVA
jgi:hypothetical protein